MDKLVTLQEVQALTALFSKTPMTPAEQLWGQSFVNRLLAHVQLLQEAEKKAAAAAQAVEGAL